ncbi:transporter associated domain-containing protein [Anaerococcus sp. AGMB09787]|uniref:transporter associated domain-containing protein n=1 Tax=Anaerococcus sp. AGMB09787 TaxID=2922869 RepID=UPI001FAF81BC|nr:transporter associated domain-containing protein [Anaerococcus sp. AGMB09787]
MKKHRDANIFIEKVASIIEFAVCLIVIAGVVAGIPKLVSYIIDFFRAGELSDSYFLMNEFLKHALLLIVGIELIAMILTRSHESILTLILFVIARKMLVYSQGLTDILIGTISVAIIFLVMKFVLSDKKLLAKIDNTFDASMPIERINRDFNMNLPTTSYTLGELIYDLASREDVRVIHENSTIVYGEYVYRIVTIENETIKRVRIEEN